MAWWLINVCGYGVEEWVCVPYFTNKTPFVQTGCFRSQPYRVTPASRNCSAKSNAHLRPIRNRRLYCELEKCLICMFSLNTHQAETLSREMSYSGKSQLLDCWVSFLFCPTAHLGPAFSSLAAFCILKRKRFKAQCKPKKFLKVAWITHRRSHLWGKTCFTQASWNAISTSERKVMVTEADGYWKTHGYCFEIRSEVALLPWAGPGGRTKEDANWWLYPVELAQGCCVCWSCNGAVLWSRGWLRTWIQGQKVKNKEIKWSILYFVFSVKEKKAFLWDAAMRLGETKLNY